MSFVLCEDVSQNPRLEKEEFMKNLTSASLLLFVVTSLSACAGGGRKVVLARDSGTRAFAFPAAYKRDHHHLSATC